MIPLEVKNDAASSSSSSSPLNLSTSEEEPKLSFSELLKGADKKDGKAIQNGALLLSLEGNEKNIKIATNAAAKNDSLLSLLNSDDGIEVDLKDIQELNPKLTQSLNLTEVKTLISDAKEYLKFQIVNSDEYKKAQIEELPKTLKGLADMAKKIGIDISKITIEEIQASRESRMLNEKPSTIDKPTTNNEKESSKLQKATAQTALPRTQTEDKKVEKQSSPLKATPLFKAQASKEHTTEQMVTVKQFKIEEKTPKDKADDTLKLLLRGEKSAQANSSLTADFSVATARVLAPSASSNATMSLEKLLHGESSNEQPSSSSARVESVTTHKPDSFEVKLNEAKQMIKYLSQDVKTAIEDYKSPFTRVKIQLNPQKLGEVDLTIVQRGKNLHVNISSNNVAINTLSMNANELKTQLTNSGINNASLNFNDSSQNSDSNASQQQQNRQNGRQADEEYNYFENEDANEEILSSLEIVVPNYA